MPQATTSGPEWAWAIPMIVGVIALIGVAVTVLLQWWSFTKQLRSAHALKLAEMKQAWMNNLRDAMSSFQSYGVAPEIDHINKREFYESGTRIELLMNPEHPDYGELQRCLYEFLWAKTREERYLANTPYMDVCQRVLKKEWEDLKREIKSA